jgi:hypothetical protein
MTGDTPAPTPEGNPENAAPTLRVPLAEAAREAGVTISALRKRYQAGDLERRHDDGGRILLDLEAVRRLYKVAEPAPGPAEAPEGSVLVPLTAWQQVLTQLGNLHQAGQDLADARERAARAEEREAFAADRRREAEAKAVALTAELEALRQKQAEAPATPERRRWWHRTS